MPLPNTSEVFTKLIACLEEAASCSRQLAFLRGQNEWLAVDERILHMRRLVISLAEAKEKGQLLQFPGSKP